LSGTLFNQKALPYLVRSLQISIPPYPTPPPGLSPKLVKILLGSDEEALQESCGLLEALCIDVEDIRLSLARGMTFPGDYSGVPCLVDMLAFIEHGAPLHMLVDPVEREKKEKAMGRCKAAVINAVTEVAGDKKNADVLWDGSGPEGKLGGKFVEKMVGWIKENRGLAHGDANARDDLVICATVALGNVVRKGESSQLVWCSWRLIGYKDAYSIAVCSPPISLVPDLAALLAPEVDIKVKNGVIGLLKNLAVAPPNRKLLGESGVLQNLASSEIWSDKYDMVELVQVAAIGIAKHICNGNRA
jgi:hypothetical protein